MQGSKAAQQSHQSATATSDLERRTTTAGGSQRSNNAVERDAYAAALRAAYSAPHRER